MPGWTAFGWLGWGRCWKEVVQQPVLKISKTWAFHCSHLWVSFLWKSQMNATNCSPQLENILDINITQIGIDECVTANCTHSSGCISKHEQSRVPTITTAGSISLVSVTVLNHALCGCAARESPHLSCSSYQTNPCLNGGTCVDTELGYRLVKLCLLSKQNASSSVCRKDDWKLEEASLHVFSLWQIWVLLYFMDRSCKQTSIFR